MNYCSIEEALIDIRAGKPLIVLDDEGRENEGDLIIAAEKANIENISFMIRHTSGILCVPMLAKDLERLSIPLMVEKNTDAFRTAFTVSVDAKQQTTTGISASDRLQTIKTLISPSSCPDDFLRPGHVFPLKYSQGGVLKRAGHTEAGIDLTVLANLHPAAVIAEIVNDNGSVSKGDQILAFAKQNGLKIITINDLIRYRHQNEKLVVSDSETVIPTSHGKFKAKSYVSLLDQTEHMVLYQGDLSAHDDVLVRVHSECLTGDALGSKRCDCGVQLQLALQKIAEEKCGVLVYLRGHEGRGIGLRHKLRAYSLQDRGCDTVDANKELGFPVDSREYGIGAQILADLGVTSMRLMTNNPAKYSGLMGYGLKIIERIPLISEPTPENYHYLMTKKKKLGHDFDLINLAEK